MQHTSSEVIGFWHYVNVLKFSTQTKFEMCEL